MLLYHGTHTGRLGAILREGLKPRGAAASNWPHNPSRPEYVYLTDAYAAYFAFAFTGDPDDYGGKMPIPAIVEVNADRLAPANFYPDEDFLTQSLWAIKQAKQLSCLTIGQRRLIQGCKTMPELHERIDPAKFPAFWQASLSTLGSVAYRGIVPASAITRYAQIDPAECRLIHRQAMDASICTANYAVCADQYRSLLAHIFDGEPVRNFAETEFAKQSPAHAARMEERKRIMDAERERGVRVAWRSDRV